MPISRPRHPKPAIEKAIRYAEQLGWRVVLSSGYNEQEAVQQTHGKKMGGFIQKPYRANEFYAVVQRALEDHGNGG